MCSLQVSIKILRGKLKYNFGHGTLVFEDNLEMNRSLTIYYSRKRVKARLLVAVEKFLISCVLNPFWSLTQKMCSKCVYVKYRQTKEKDEKSAWKKCRRKVDEVSAGFLFLYILDDLDSLIILISHLQIHYQKYVRQNLTKVITIHFCF